MRQGQVRQQRRHRAGYPARASRQGAVQAISGVLEEGDGIKAIRSVDEKFVRPVVSNDADVADVRARAHRCDDIKGHRDHEGFAQRGRAGG